MKKLFFLLLIYLTSCDINEKQLFDLFPLAVGNEFYYTYYKYEASVGYIPSYTKGTERWKVISVTLQGDSSIYKVERRLNATKEGGYGQSLIYSLVIQDSLKFFELIEYKTSSVLSSSSMLLKNIRISFKRYQPDPIFEIKGQNYTRWQYVFKADSGLTKFSYNAPANYHVEESLKLDSLIKYP